MSDDDHVLPRAEARVGQLLCGKWRLESLIGVGGMAAVYAARHRNAKRVAIKILHREVAANDRMRSRFLREGYAANRVEHSGVVSVLDDDSAEDGAAFLVMDLLQGESLEARRLRSGGTLPPLEVLALAERVLDVLEVAHRTGIVHRDLKPENLFLTTSGELKVLDFGIASLKELGFQRTGTQTGIPLGTPAYMPPEQASGHWELVDARCDLWALGATMFALATGRLVHDGTTIPELLVSAMQPVAPTKQRAPELPDTLAGVIDHALAFEKEARFADAASMRRAIREARNAMGGVSSSADLAPAAALSAVGPGPAMSTGYAATVSGEVVPSSALPQRAGLPRRTRIALAIAGASVLLLMLVSGVALLQRRRSHDLASPAAETELTVDPVAAVGPPASAVSTSPIATNTAIPSAEPAVQDAGMRPSAPRALRRNPTHRKRSIGPISDDL